MPEHFSTVANIYETWSLKREMLDILHHTEHLLAVWQHKFVGSLALAGVSVSFDLSRFFNKDAAESVLLLFGADSFLLALVFLLTCFDLFLGITQACIKQCFSAPTLKRGLAKLPLYCIYIFLIAVMSISLQRSTGFGGGLLNLFLAYLCITEIFSIIKNFERLGLYMPPLLQHIVYGVSHKIEKTIKDTYKIDAGHTMPETYYEDNETGETESNQETISKKEDDK